MSTQEHVQDHADHHAAGSRRSFLKSAALASAMPAVLTTPRGSNTFELGRMEELTEPRPYGPNDRIRIATIGMGIIGFIDTKTALKVPGTELVAVAARAPAAVLAEPERLIGFLVDQMLVGYEQDDDITVLVVQVPPRDGVGPDESIRRGRRGPSTAGRRRGFPRR